MPLTDIGPKAFQQAQTVATLAFTPLYDRAAIVTDILIDNPSAADTWVVSTAGREQLRFDIRATGNQQPVSNSLTNYPKGNSLFHFYNAKYPDTYLLPVPMGQTMTIQSVGGATADITVTFKEVAPGELSVGMMNHPSGNRFVVPIVGFRAANVTAVGEQTFDSQVAPSWFPNIFVDGLLPPNWVFKILAMFLEGGGVNTFSGAANHQSATSYFAVIKNGRRLFTRAALGGIPLIGLPSAAGSANVVVGTEETPYPSFQQTSPYVPEIYDNPIVLSGGDEYQFRFNVAGDVTGGAAYTTVRQMLLVDVSTAGSNS